ncbi:HAD family hydrolase [Streptomyces sp. NBC_00388]|uniref:HAD family hydrolase n=1 Tax=Streptomyces sp. NBC_00388 TaxID=2975735 RepID=UPI002E234278
MQTPAIPAHLLDDIECCVFDLDGTVTRTELQHRRAWHEAIRTTLGEGVFTPADYHELDGLPPVPALREFAARRRCLLPDGEANDNPHRATAAGIVARKRELYADMLAREGADPYPGTLHLLRRLKNRGIPLAVVSASASCRQVLLGAGLSSTFDVIVDGTDIQRQGLRGKPEPDCFLHAVTLLGSRPDRCAVFEDAPSGLRAARRGGFAPVIAIDRSGQAPRLLAEEPDILVYDLAQLLS